eukprot:SAG22_NODE_384_length_11306_cov_12.130365_4_plen_936_part_00
MATNSAQDASSSSYWAGGMSTDEDPVINVTTSVYSPGQGMVALLALSEALSATSETEDATVRVTSSLVFNALPAVMNSDAGRMAVRQKLATKLGMRMSWIIIPEDGVSRRRQLEWELEERAEGELMRRRLQTATVTFYIEAPLSVATETASLLTTFAASGDSVAVEISGTTIVAAASSLAAPVVTQLLEVSVPAGPADPFPVLLYRQTREEGVDADAAVPTSRDELSEWESVAWRSNPATEPNYSVLGGLEDAQRGADGKFVFKLVWPQMEVAEGGKNYNIWKQTTNPMEAATVEGYEAVDVNHDFAFSGLRLTTGARRLWSLLQGSESGWLYAVGCIQTLAGGFPGPGTTESQVELYVYPPRAGFNTDTLGVLLHAGGRCWSHCNPGGRCSYCGAGHCCQSGLEAAGCDGTIGGQRVHVCVDSTASSGGSVAVAAEPAKISGLATFPIADITTVITDAAVGSEMSEYDRLHIMFAGQFVAAMAALLEVDSRAVTVDSITAGSIVVGYTVEVGPTAAAVAPALARLASPAALVVAGTTATTLDAAQSSPAPRGAASPAPVADDSSGLSVFLLGLLIVLGLAGLAGIFFGIHCCRTRRWERDKCGQPGGRCFCPRLCNAEKAAERQKAAAAAATSKVAEDKPDEAEGASAAADGKAQLDLEAQPLMGAGAAMPSKNLAADPETEGQGAVDQEGELKSVWQKMDKNGNNKLGEDRAHHYPHNIRPARAPPAPRPRPARAPPGGASCTAHRFARGGPLGRFSLSRSVCVSEKVVVICRVHNRSAELDEVRLVLKAMGRQASDRALQKAFGEMDTDGSGAIDYPEFCRWFFAEIDAEVDTCFKAHAASGGDGVGFGATVAVSRAAVADFVTAQPSLGPISPKEITKVFETYLPYTAQQLGPPTAPLSRKHVRELLGLLHELRVQKLPPFHRLKSRKSEQ